MTIAVRRLLVAAAFVTALAGLGPAPAVHAGAGPLPNRLGDQEFWKLVSDVSEPNGSFRSDNLVSNELQFQTVIPDLLRTVRAGRVYLGVGPEQNFTYIAALKPSMAFIVDVRRGNRDLQLLYKSLFELSADRAEFVSRLFSRPRPEGLTAKSTAEEIFSAFAASSASWRLSLETMSSVRHQLLTKHRFGLSEEDLRGIEYVFNAFTMLGPTIQYSPFGLNGGTVQPTYAALMAATDSRGEARAFLATEESFRFVKTLESRNLLVPVVGNFAGSHALRGIGSYLKERGAIVGTFYLSNVEEYLKRDGIWQDFCDNVSALPLDPLSTFIRSQRPASNDPSDGLRSEVGPMTAIANCR